jgi:hypothetical protein
MLVCGSHSSVLTTTYQHFSITNTELWLPHTNIPPLQTQSYDYHIPTSLSYNHRAMTTTYQHFSLTNTELWLPHTNISALQTQSYNYHIPTFLRYKHRLWLPHTNISPLQTQSYKYHIPTCLSYKHRAITTTYQHFSLTNTELWLPQEMLVCSRHSSVFAREKCWYVGLPHTNMSALETQNYDYHMPTFLPCNHRAITTTYQHFSPANTELWLPHTKISPLQTKSYTYHIPTFR